MVVEASLADWAEINERKDEAEDKLMVSRQELEGKWEQVKGRLQDRWGQLTEDELQRVRGNASALVGVIEEKTGESRREIEAYLDQMFQSGTSTARAAADSAREYGHWAAESAQAGYDQVADSVRSGYQQAEGSIRRNPTESVAVAFGAGVITGVVVALAMRSR